VGGFCRKNCIQRGNGLNFFVILRRGVGTRGNCYQAKRGVGGGGGGGFLKEEGTPQKKRGGDVFLGKKKRQRKLYELDV